ncbi:MAG: DUF5107 domain-containing protein [Verrucomicrobia bacterium]|nr:DUF5107 domain-containing protein [Verrucomicrobiota bacterium]
MTFQPSTLELGGIRLTRIESEHLRVDIAPAIGGRVVSLIEKRTGHEFLWRNSRVALQAMPPGSAYDPNFFGGIDELLPNDIPECIDGVECPDHGELWTTALDCTKEDGALLLRSTLPLTGLRYEKRVALAADSPCIELHYRIANPTGQTRHFMWKLHAALAIEPGDVIECPARHGQVADLAWSRFSTLERFAWPQIQGQAANVIPKPGDQCDFFYLSGLEAGRMAWRRPGTGLEFRCEFDTKVFPYAWLFASYGGFDGHFTAILEPCTSMPISVNQADGLGQCTVLAPGQSLETRVAIHACRNSNP